jgi:nucleotide-binding universal stress UspA family protein
VYKKILVGYDGSEAGKKAFDTALELAARDKSDLYVVSVSRPPEFGDEVETEAVIESSREHHRKLLGPLQALALRRNVHAHFEVAVGHAAEQIIYHADRHQVDLIVVGHRGRSKFARLLLGSVSKQVTEHADRPVLVVR